MRIIENFKCPIADCKITGFSSGHQFGEDPRLRLMSGFPTVGGKKSIPAEGLTRELLKRGVTGIAYETVQ